LNVSSDGDDVTVAGKLFHTRAAATGKAVGETGSIVCMDPKNRKAVKKTRQKQIYSEQRVLASQECVS